MRYDEATDKAILPPKNKLKRGKTYVATVKTGATDLAGNELEQDPNATVGVAETWSFRVRR